MARCGTYPAPAPPCVIGYEVAGEVESVGAGVESVREGDGVCAATRFGGYSEHAVPHKIFPPPQDVAFEQGAAFPVNYGTAYAALVIMGGVRAGDRVLIHSAGGGVGTAATPVADHAGRRSSGSSLLRANGVDRDRLPFDRLRGRGAADHRRRRRGRDHRRARTGELPETTDC